MKSKQGKSQNKRFRSILLPLLLIFALFLSACEIPDTDQEENVNSYSQFDSSVSEIEENTQIETEKNETETNETETSQSDQSEDYSFNLSDIPEYSGEAFVTVNDNTPTFTAEELSAEVYESYSPHDSLGRCGVAMAMIGKSLLPTEERGEIGSVKPAGWHTVKYPDLIDGNYLYNRCHLLAYELTGENANEKNLITGTRYMNVQGMLPFENFITAYVKKTGNHVLYRVTPIYDGNDLVARGVWMEAESVGAKGVCFSVFCYNIQPGVAIDYATGDSCEDDTYKAYVGNTTGSVDSVAAGGTYYAGSYTVAGDPEEDSSSSPDSGKSSGKSDSGSSGSGSSSGSGKYVDSVDQCDYVVNVNTGKFHKPSCSSVNRMNESNKRFYCGSAASLEAEGYSPCKNCID